jgi:putative transposase
MPNHVHLIVGIPPRISVADVIKNLKGFISFAFGKGFSWQRGYGVMTFGEGQRPQAMAYVQNQRQLHADGETNRWLERYDEYDEGPPDHGLLVDDFAATMNESSPSYNSLGEAPF